MFREDPEQTLKKKDIIQKVNDAYGESLSGNATFYSRTLKELAVSSGTTWTFKQGSDGH